MTHSTRQPARAILPLLVALLAPLVLTACGEDSVRLFQFVSTGGGGHTLDLSGGEGTDSDGGSGGNFVIDIGTDTGVFVLPSASVDGSFSVPSRSIGLGDNPRTVTSDTTITPTAGGTTIPREASTWASDWPMAVRPALDAQ